MNALAQTSLATTQFAIRIFVQATSNYKHHLAFSVIFLHPVGRSKDTGNIITNQRMVACTSTTKEKTRALLLKLIVR